MDEDRLELMCQEYQHLEDRFLKLTSFIPLSSDFSAPNYQFTSPRAAEFLLDCCMWLETLMKELHNDSRLNDFPEIESTRRKKQSIEIYRDVFERKYGFSGGGWSLRYLGGEEIRPFSAWAKGETPDWFKIYSREKHDRISLAQSCTMGHALQAFVALTVVFQHWKWPPPSPYFDRRSRVLEGVIY